MSSGAPSWVYKREQALRDISHRNYERQLQDKIKQLEKENSDLKKKITKMENGFLIAMELLLKKY